MAARQKINGQIRKSSMKKICGLLLPLTILCSCGDIKVETKQDWGFNKTETEDLYRKGMQLASENKTEESIVEFKKALQIEPENILLLFETGNSYKSLNKLDDAEGYYNKVLNATPVYALVYPNIANLMLAKKDNVSAIKYGKIGLQKCDTDKEKAECAFNIAAGYYNIDSCDQAEKYFMQTSQLRKGVFTDYDNMLKDAILTKCKGQK
jgi:tetratricopeptide (TPR) repeat protein